MTADTIDATVAAVHEVDGPGGHLDERARLRGGAHGRRTLLTLGAVVLLVVTVGVWRYETRPFTAFAGGGTDVSGPDRVGQPIHAAFAFDLPSVTVVRARPVLADDSVAAAVGVSVCLATPDEPGPGVVVGDLASSCSSILSIGDRNLAGLGSRSSLVVTVVPLVPGHVRVRAVDVTYRADGRTGTERIPAKVLVRAR